MENKKIIWRDEMEELNFIPVADIEIVYDRIFGKLEVLAYDKKGAPYLQKCGQWTPAIKDHYIQLAIEDGKNTNLYQSTFEASCVKAYYNHLKNLDHDNVAEPTFKFTTSTQSRLKKEKIDLNVEDVINFGSDVITKYSIANMKNTHKEYDERYGEEVQEYLEAKEGYFWAKNRPEIYDENEIAEKKTIMKNAEQEYNKYCELNACHNLGNIVGYNENWYIFEEHNFRCFPDILAKTIYNGENKTKATEYKSNKTQTKAHEDTKSL